MSIQLEEIRAVVMDADGVLFRGRQPLPGVRALFDFLRRHHIAHMIATNRTARPASDVVEILTEAGARIDDTLVLTAAQATVLSLPRLAPNARRVLVVGGGVLGKMLAEAGYQLVDQDADVVVAGIDVALTYDKLWRATREIRRGAKFIGTNADKTYPAANDLAPGAGAILAALEAASGRAPIIIGKPERPMFDLAVEKMGASPRETIILGDCLETDIEGGARAGLKSVLVLTGVTNHEVLAKSSIKPDLIFENLDALRETWAGAVSSVATKESGLPIARIPRNVMRFWLFRCREGALHSARGEKRDDDKR